MSHGKSGFLAGAFSSATSSLAQSSGEFSVLRSRVGSDLFSAISGGLGAEIGGGNFFIGAIQGLAVNEFNHLMHKEEPYRAWRSGGIRSPNVWLKYKNLLEL